MSLAASSILVAPATVLRWGRVALLGALVFFSVLAVVGMVKSVPLLAAIPLLLIGSGVLVFVVRRPVLNLAIVLLGWIIVADYTEGIQIAEAAYGFYFMSYLACWFIHRLLLVRESILERSEARALLGFLILVTAYAPLTFLFGGKPGGLFSEWVSLVMLGLYFPVRDVIARHENGVRAVLLVLMFVTVVAVLRNFINYQMILLSATQAWQVSRARIYTNDSVMMTACIGALAALGGTRKWQSGIAAVGLFLVYAAGLILTQSRAFWVSFLLGALLLLYFAEPHVRRRLVVVALTGFSILSAVALVWFGDLIILVAGGLGERFASLTSAVTRDVSLLNRFSESMSVMKRIVDNPVLGYGMGVPYPHYDITWQSTRYDAFIHNGFISLWYKFGPAGLGLLLFVWLSMIRRGIQAIRSRRLGPWHLVAALTGTCALAAYLLPANTSNPFFLNDTTFLLGVLFGLAGGAYERSRGSRERILPDESR